MAPRQLIFCVALALACTASQGAAAPPPRSTVFTDIIVNEKVDGDVVAFEADVHLGPMADVAGDVVVVGGDVQLDAGARVGRHVLTIFGSVDRAPDAVIDGRTLVFSSLSNVLLRPEDQMPLQISLAVRLLTSGGWLLLTTGLAFCFPARLRYGVWIMPQLGFRVLILGLAAGVTFFAAVVAVLGFGPALGVPLAAAVTVIFFAFRTIGLTVVGGFLGGWAARRWYHRPLPLTLEVFVGVFAMLALRFVPVIGGVAWSVCSIAALGTGIMTLATTGADRATAASLS